MNRPMRLPLVTIVGIALFLAHARASGEDARMLITKALLRTQGIQSGWYRYSYNYSIPDLDDSVPTFVTLEVVREGKRVRVAREIEIPSDVIREGMRVQLAGEIPGGLVSAARREDSPAGIAIAPADHTQEMRTRFFELCFGGDSWVLNSFRDATFKNPNISLSIGERRAIYTKHRIDNAGGIQHYLLMEVSNESYVQFQASSGLRASPTRAGCVPTAELEEYLWERRDSAIHGGIRMIDGLSVNVVDVRVEKDDFARVFGEEYSYSYLYVGDFALIRCFICEELGYAMPRIEFVSATEKSYCRFESRDFFLVDGFHIPKYTTRLLESFPNPVREDLEILGAKYLNTEIPPEIFQISIPEGTLVTNTIPNERSVFTLGTHATLDRIDSTLIDADAAPSKIPLRLVAVAVCAFSLIVFVGYRFRKIVVSD